MKKILSFLFTTMFAAQTWAATTFEINGLKYTVINGTNVSVSKGSTDPYGSVTIPAKVTNGNTTYTVKSIANDAFRGCAGLASVIFADQSNVETIGGSAFYGCNNLSSISIPGSVKTIEGNAFRECVNLTSITIPNSVTSIKGGAFYRCSGLTSITIPNSVTSIASQAFYKCSSLTSVTIGASVTTIDSQAFEECSGLTSVTIPNSVTKIGYRAFRYCSGLTSVTFASTSKVESIDDDAFQECISLTSITIPNSVKSIGKYAFFACFSLSSVTFASTSKVTIINDGTFCECRSLTSIAIPNSVTSIGKGEYQVSGAFSGCSSLKSVIIPNSVTSIASSAFFRCTNLIIIDIPNSVEEIGSDAFYGAKNINYHGNAGDPDEKWGAKTRNGFIKDGLLFSDAECTDLIYYIGDRPENYTVTIPNSVREIRDYAFETGSELMSVNIPSSVTTIGINIFKNCEKLSTIKVVDENKHENGDENAVYRSENGVLIRKEGDTLICCPAGKSGSFSIPDGVKGIGRQAFSECNKQTEVTIPNSVTTIGNSAFYKCSGLKKVNVSESVTSIGEWAFQDCRNLTTINIPNSVTSIGEAAFSECRSLTEIAISESVTNINSQTFQYCTSLTSVTIPNSVTSIASQAFYECSSLELVTIPNSVTSIGSSAFSGCSSLESVTIPNSVTSIGKNAFSNVKSIIYYGNAEGCPWNALKHIKIDDVFDFEYPEKTIIKEYKGPWSDVLIPNSVTKIGDEAFLNNSSLSSVSISESVTEIGRNAFRGCSNLAKVTIPNSVTNIDDGAFDYCSALASITIPGSVTSIGENAFRRTSLQSIVIPESVENIGNGVFDDCDILKTIDINTETIGAFFSGCRSLNTVNIGKSVKNIDGKAFSGCTNLTTINIDDQNEDFAIENGVLFSKDKTTLIYCPARKKDGFVIPKSVTSITEGALQDIGMTYRIVNGCTYLGDTPNPYRWLVSVEPSDNTLLTVNNRCEYIIGNAFNGCSNLAYINIPESVTEVGDKAFDGCSAALYCTAESRPEGWSTEASASKVFWGMNVTQNGFVYSLKNGQSHNYIGDNKTNITIPQNIDEFTITSIGAKAFSNCPDLQSVSIPATIKSIDKTAFKGCNNIKTLTYDTDSLGQSFAGCNSLETVIVGNNVTIITNGTFEDCSNMRSATVGTLVKTIGDRAFANCSELRELTIVSSVLSNIGKEAFRGCYKIKTATVPNSVSAIGKDAFHYVKNVAYSGNADGSPWGALTLNGVIDGDFVYLNDKKEKITAYIGDGSDVEIPQSVDNIGPMAFFESDNLKRVTILDNSVAIINESAFGNCRNLESINIPKTVAIIGYGAFRECYSVKVYCEVASQPDLWNENWNYRITDNQIVWGSYTEVSESATSAVNIYAYGNKIVVENATGEICIYDAMGKLVCRDATHRVRTEITIPTLGVYIVKTGNIAQRVMAK